jgi:hypothetical protein
VFVRDPQDRPEWAERFRWDGAALVPLPDQAAAEARAAETRHLHPGWEVEARQTSDPLPGTFRETFAAYFPPGWPS